MRPRISIRGCDRCVHPLVGWLVHPLVTRYFLFHSDQLRAALENSVQLWASLDNSWVGNAFVKIAKNGVMQDEGAS